ncbi:hypothetical protein IWZ00DRAFT_519309 [Phyllosticta capitalensis]
MQRMRLVRNPVALAVLMPVMIAAHRKSKDRGTGKRMGTRVPPQTGPKGRRREVSFHGGNGMEAWWIRSLIN